ncbi:Phosphotransferase [Vibrio crassostreae]|nr:Phosphotransferase [Vibrio crassostreae]CAK2240301.1 Phosphotransferase [Vibrio crassostreae]CAK2241837.1 Phosphotransferase [Vibrio crassostreae]CAK2247234.1 Phosphotransferase [Vibrio crassostreae]CAK2393678.1 Phosphotransferase [Vibrio crassostreae]
MKKVDLHLHTIATQSDARFDFSLDTLKKYVEVAELDCIAITNHNVFDELQYKEIVENIGIKVLPGIEVDLEGGHILVLADDTDVIDFAERCREVERLVTYPNPNVSLEDFKRIFQTLGKYILIPHYDKSPKVPKYVLEALSSEISAGEVQSAKKFIQASKDEGSLVPVLFSDQRMKIGMQEFESRSTYIAIENVDFRSLKLGLTKKGYVNLTLDEGNRFFEVSNSGLKLSTGLNVVLGKRSSGKSFTLNKIEEFSGEDEIKFIRQFELLESDEDKDKREFDTAISKNQSEFTEKYLAQFKAVVDDVYNINVQNDEGEVESYIQSVVENANNVARKDIFSKAKLFNEQRITLKELGTLKDLVSSVQLLLDNTEYSEIIESAVKRENLITLHSSLVEKFRVESKSNKHKQMANDIISKVKLELGYKTTHKTIDDIDLRKIALNRAKVKCFEKLVSSIQKERQIEKKELYGYSVVAERKPFVSATDLKTVARAKVSLVNAFSKYKEPFDYIDRLKDAGIEDVELYKYFSKVSYRILNKYGTTVSGGERSEYRLLRSLHDAKNYDILLIDEPESSFDNVFLFESVNKIIKDLSQQMPVVVVTHNNTVGASIEPDYILYTSKTMNDDELVYDVYSGLPTDKYLKTIDGKEIENYNIQIDSLEAGHKPYQNRGEDYANLKN